MNANSEKPTVRILHHMARSGGTLICRCLGSMQGLTLLSEVSPVPYYATNPQTAHECAQFHPIVQAYKWFGLFTIEEAELLASQWTLDYATLIQLVHRRCEERGETLLLRDWSHADFTSHAPFPPPTYQFSIVEALRDQFEIKRTSSVRHPIDQWLSLRRLLVIHGHVSLEQFLYGYRRFAEECVKIGFVRYDDVVRSPETEIQKICTRLDLPYDANFTTNWANYFHVTGDIKSNRENAKIKQLPRREFEPELMRQFEANDDYWKALDLLGFAHPQGVADRQSTRMIPEPNFMAVEKGIAANQSSEESSL